ncbi:MAG: hypothetical protein PHY59_04340 [Methanobacterium sp.]|nr:hypothetical protein [Methanobacterium sp.]
MYYSLGYGYDRVDKEVVIHVRDFMAGLYPFDESGTVNINEPLKEINISNNNLFKLYALPVAYNPQTQKYDRLPTKISISSHYVIIKMEQGEK